MFKIAIVFCVAAGVMLLVFRGAQWRVDNTTLPRYCEDPEGTVIRVGRILTRGHPVEQGKRRAYIIAAKLIFLIPQNDNEQLEAYLERLRRRVSQTCIK